MSNTCAEALFSYRTHCATTSPAGQLVLPESLKLYPLYSLGIIKSLCFRYPPLLGSPFFYEIYYFFYISLVFYFIFVNRDNGKISQGEDPDPRADERCWHYQLLKYASPSVTHRLLQPRLFDVASFDPTVQCTPPASPSHKPETSDPSYPTTSDSLKNVMAPGGVGGVGGIGGEEEKAMLPGQRMKNGHIALPLPLHCSAAQLGADKVMLLDAGSVIYMWVGSNVDEIILHEVFSF